MREQLYVLDGHSPGPLPFRITMPDGRTRTDPKTFTAAEISAAGYVKAPAQPACDSETQQLAWNAETKKWVVELLPPPPGAHAYTLTRRQLRSAVALAGIPRDAIPNAIEQIDDSLKCDLALIDWEDAPFYKRDHPLFANPQIIEALDLTAEAIDAMWLLAKDLPE
ncbi:hypothetical protein [Devosia sp. 919]|uniref:hypothetical protein n=1 Tax=Devosia sp. 919 TaxID=2726065 RepID=UPI001553644A|nr:hypothetical protein [Devosia sp. 919]